MKSFNSLLYKHCQEKNNRLCVGLDIDINNLPTQTITYMESYIKDIIDCSINLCPIYKINLAFYERLGYKGIQLIETLCKYIDSRAIVIGDAKRGDIGNSSKYYAEAIFEKMNFDAITVSPYMGTDSIEPFIKYKNKGVFILCLTSNKGSKDLQYKIINNESTVFSYIAALANKLNINNNIGLVVGATQNDRMKELKVISGSLPWLIPGVGFQGGNLEDSLKIGSLNNSLPIINVSRGILSAGNMNQIQQAVVDYTNEIRKFI